MKGSKFKKGDTLIEVILAMSIFAALMVGALYLMNSGLARAQTTLQITMARNLMDSQAELLRFSNAAFIANYPNSIPANSAASRWQSYISETRIASDLSDCSDKSHSFIINPVNGEKQTDNSLKSADTFPMIVYDLPPNVNNNVNNNDSNHIMPKNNYNEARGIWIQAVQGASSKFYDFHIRACWSPAGSSHPITLGTIVRLYVPTN